MGNSCSAIKRIHVEFAGLFKNKMWLLAVDAFSKWPEIHTMETTTDEAHQAS